MNRYSVAVESEDFLKSDSNAKSEKLSNTKEMLSLSYSDINKVELKHSTSVVSRDESISSKTSFHNMFPNIMRLTDQVSNVGSPKPKNTMDLCDNLLSTLKEMLNKYSACSYSEEGSQSEDFNVTCSKLEDRIRKIENIFDNYMKNNDVRNDKLKNLQNYITSFRNGVESNNRLSSDECNPLEIYNSASREMCQIESNIEEFSGKLQFQIMNIDACSRIKPQDQYELTIRSGDAMFFKTRIKVEKNGYQMFDCRNFTVTPTAENEIHIRFCELKTLNKSTLILEKKLTNINDLISIEPNIYSVWLTPFGLIKLNVIVQWKFSSEIIWSGMIANANTNRQFTLIPSDISGSIRSRNSGDDRKSTGFRHSMNVDGMSSRLFESLSMKNRSSSIGEIKEEDNRQNSPIPLKNESQTASIPSVIIQCDSEWDKGKGDSTLMTKAETLEITMEHDEEVIDETNNTKNLHESISPINSLDEILSSRNSRNEFDSESENIDSPIIELSLDTNNNNENNLSIDAISNSSSIERVNDISILKDDIRATSEDEIEDSNGDKTKYIHQNEVKDTHEDEVKGTHEDAVKDTHEDEVKDKHEDEVKDTHEDAVKYTHEDEVKDKHEDEVKGTHDDEVKYTYEDETKGAEIVNEKDASHDGDNQVENSNVEVEKEEVEINEIKCEFNINTNNDSIECIDEAKENGNEENETCKINKSVDNQNLENYPLHKSQHDEEANKEDDLKLGMCVVTEEIENFEEVVNECIVSEKVEHGNEIIEVGEKDPTKLDDFQMTSSNENHKDVEQSIDNCEHDTSSEIKGEIGESECQNINNVDTTQDSQFNNLIPTKTDSVLSENVTEHQSNNDGGTDNTNLQGEANLIVYNDVNKMNNTDDLTKINTIAESINADLNIPSN